MYPEEQNREGLDPSAHRFKAARADMEMRTGLPAARHYIENRLAAFGHAVCTRNSSQLEALTRGVAITLTKANQSSGIAGEPTRIIDWFAHSAPSVTHIITNLSVHYDGPAVAYVGTFQEWVAAPEHWTPSLALD